MEIAGIPTVNPCSECLCASCRKGFIGPTATNDCIFRTVNCDNCKRNLREGKSELPLTKCEYYSVE